ncbi:tubulin alpha 1 [Serendipita sp. 411]|nr:tubulin alpha 1 [Serendipita sp. 411]
MGEYWEASVQSIDFAKKEVICTSALQHWDPSKSFSIKYDKLVMAVGAHTQTFNIPGVREHAFFLKETRDAIKIRKRILGCKSAMALKKSIHIILQVSKRRVYRLPPMIVNDSFCTFASSEVDQPVSNFLRNFTI